MGFRMLADPSDFERDQISDRTRFALDHKRAQGEKTGGDVPYGYRVENGRLVPHPEEQKAVALILDLHLAGFSLRGIARELEARGHLTRRGRPVWHPDTIKGIIDREAA